MATSRNSKPRKAVRKILQNWGIVLIVSIIAFGFVIWSRKAQPNIVAENTATVAPTKVQVTATSLPIQDKVVEEVPSQTPTMQATEEALYPINWGQLSTFGLEISKSYVVDDVCVSVPAGWIPFTPNGEKKTCEEPVQNLREGLVLPTGIAVIPAGSIPTPNFHQTAVAGKPLSDPNDQEDWNYRVCLLKKYDKRGNIAQYWLEIDYDFDLLPVSGGDCFTTVGKGYIQVSFFFLNQIYEEIKAGDYKYEVHLDQMIQGGQNQELWLGGKSLSNK
jgi:hypothetical protein